MNRPELIPTKIGEYLVEIDKYADYLEAELAKAKQREVAILDCLCPEAKDSHPWVQEFMEDLRAEALQAARGATEKK